MNFKRGAEAKGHVNVEEEGLTQQDSESAKAEAEAEAEAVHPNMSLTSQDLEIPSDPSTPPPPSSSPISPRLSPIGSRHGNSINNTYNLSPESLGGSTPMGTGAGMGMGMEPVGLTVNIMNTNTNINGRLSPKRSSQNTAAALNIPVNLERNRASGTVFEIEAGTPAAEALRANADVRVTKVGKVARYLHVNAVRKTAKQILHVGSGVKRGKPPRVPDITETPEDIDQFLNEENKRKLKLGILSEREDEDMMDDDEEDVLGDADFKLSPMEEVDDEHELFKSAHSHTSDCNIPLPRPNSSSSSDSGVPSKIMTFNKSQKITLLDSKGLKREIKLERKLKKKMKKREKKRKKRNYVKGKVIDGHHELYTLSIAMMLGLRYSIFLTNNQLVEDRKNDRMWLDSDEFMKVEKYIFRPDGRNNTPPHQLSHTFKFKDYSPLPFAFIRRMFGINEYEFHHSVCGNANFIEFISNAKSGQFFFYSSDGKYMIKTMTNQESKFLRRSKFVKW